MPRPVESLSEYLIVSRLPKVPIHAAKISDHGYVARGKRWSVADLIQAVKEQDLTPFKVPLATINLTSNIWDVEDLDDIIYHMKRVQVTDLDYPIIYDVYGCICDGWHRIAKAILQGDTSIQAVRLNTMPTSTPVESNT